MTAYWNAMGEKLWLATWTKTNFYQYMQKDVFEQPQYLTLQQQVKNNSQKKKKKRK